MQKRLKKEVVMQYDYIKTKKNLEKLISKISVLECKFMNIKFPTITPSYEFKYECFTQKRVDKVGNYIERKLDTEADIDELYQALTEATELLTADERYYFVETFLKDLSEEVVIANLNKSKTGFIPIKESCVIKLGIALGVAIESNN